MIKDRTDEDSEYLNTDINFEQKTEKLEDIEYEEEDYDSGLNNRFSLSGTSNYKVLDQFIKVYGRSIIGDQESLLDPHFSNQSELSEV